MAQDWLSDVRKYVADADEAVVDKIVKYLGIALQNRDSSLVSFSDKTETDRVRENFLKKKLALTLPDSDLDEAIAHVGARMKDDRTKNRVTVYYLLAEHFGLLNLFGGAAGTAAAGAATAAAAALGLGATAAPTEAAAAAAPVAEPVRMVSEAPASYGNDDGGSGGGLGWLKWLLLALLLLLLLFLALRYCAPHDGGSATHETPAATSDAGNMAAGDTATDAAAVTAPAVPQGSGVVATEVAGKPKLTVYFDTGKTDVSNDLAAAAANVKAYLDKNPGSKLAVSGFNDPTGNAAINAEVSKKRAQGVQAALEKVGIPKDAIELVKPADTTDTSGDNTAARRVEVTIK